MNLDFYRNYIKIVECGTLSAAARTLHMAQSALSSQVKQFEEEYATSLFIRNARQMEPTDAGRILYERAKNIVMLVDASYKEVEACAGGAQGTVRIGMTQVYPDVEMTNLLLQFQNDNPHIRFEFYENSSSEIIELLRTGVIEIGIVRTSGLLPPYLEEMQVFPERLCVYCCYNNPWITPYDSEVPLSSLEQVPLAISRGFSDLLRDIFDRANVHPVIMSVATSRNNPVMWAKAGAMIAIICTGDAASFNDAEAFCRPLTADDPVIASELRATRSFIVAKDRMISAAAQKFLCFSKQHFMSTDIPKLS